jgi:hypothetical protein
MLGVVVAGYIIDHFCLWFETSVVRSMFYIWIYYRSFCLRADIPVFGDVEIGYIVDNH